MMNQVNFDKFNTAQGWQVVNGYKTGNSGFALIASLMVLVMLTLLAVVSLRSSLVEEMTSGNQKQAASALCGAERGVSQALDALLDGTINDTGNETEIGWIEGAWANGTGYTSTYTVGHLITGGTAVEDDDGRRYFLINSSPCLRATSALTSTWAKDARRRSATSSGDVKT